MVMILMITQTGDLNQECKEATYCGGGDMIMKIISQPHLAHMDSLQDSRKLLSHRQHLYQCMA